MLLQETWVTPYNKAKIGSIHKDYLFHSISGIDDDEILRGRPYGGLAILWHQRIQNYVHKIQTLNSRRLCGVTFDNGTEKMTIVNCYFPCDNYSKSAATDDFLDICDELESFIVSCNDSMIIVGGDLNMDFNRRNQHDSLFTDLLGRRDLVLAWNIDGAHSDYTYTDFGNNAFSCIDHFCVDYALKDDIISVTVLDEALNMSHHSPICMVLKVDFVLGAPAPDHSGVSNRIEWHKVDSEAIKSYKQSLNFLVMEMPYRDVYDCKDINCQNSHHFMQLNDWCCDLVNYCLQADNVFPRKCSYKKQRPGWNDLVKPFKEDNLFWFNTWRCAGKPRSGSLYDYMKSARKQYFYAVRRIKRQENSLRNDKMASALAESNCRDFFAEIKRMKPARQSRHGINGCCDSKVIVNIFAEKYKNLYNSVPSDQDTLNRIKDSVNVTLSGNHCDGDIVAHETVKAAIAKLKHEKSDGNLGYISSHLLYASNAYHMEISKMMNSMFIHGYQPDLLTAATLISIPKDYSADMCNDNNYRGIALSSSLSKLFDQVFIVRNNDKLNTSQLQFAFKANMGTTMCTLVLKEVLKYYNNNKSSVYSCFLDASKAFDRVRHDKLFQLLQSRNLPALDLRILMNQYERQCIRTEWQGEYSAYFKASNGIRQGSIVSPVLFNVYLDEMLQRLEYDGTGCWIGNKYFGVIAYADDVTLLCPTLAGLQKMICTCENFSKEYQMEFNFKKTVCVKFGRHIPCNQTVYLNGIILPWHNHAKHLGNVLSSDISECKEISKKRSEFIGRVNGLLGTLKSVQVKSLMKVFQSQCCYYYGVEAWNLRNPDVNKFHTAFNRGVRRLLQLPPRTHTRLLPEISGIPLSVDSVSLRCVRLYRSMAKSENSRVKFMYDYANDSKMTIIGNNLDFIRTLYEFRESELPNVKSCFVSKPCDTVDQPAITAIKDLLFGHLDGIYNDIERCVLLHDLCVN